MGVWLDTARLTPEQTVDAILERTRPDKPLVLPPLTATMEAHDVLAVLGRFAQAAVVAWVDGGWGVDALVGRASRPHADLDLVITRHDLGLVEQALGAVGYHRDPAAKPGLPARLVLRDEARRAIDLRPVTFDAVGNGWQQLGPDAWGEYPVGGLAGVGAIAGRHVRCLTPQLQVHHLGYRLDTLDRHNLDLLTEHLGLASWRPWKMRRTTSGKPLWSAWMQYEAIVGEFTQQAETFNTTAFARAAQTLDELVRLAAPQPTDRWLDAACGPGLVTRTLAPLVREVVAVDMTPAMVDVARREAAAAGVDNATFSVGDATRRRCRPRASTGRSHASRSTTCPYPAGCSKSSLASCGRKERSCWPITSPIPTRTPWRGRRRSSGSAIPHTRHACRQRGCESSASGRPRVRARAARRARARLRRVAGPRLRRNCRSLPHRASAQRVPDGAECFGVTQRD